MTRFLISSDSLHGHTCLVMSLDVSSDGYLLLSGSKDNTAILWSVVEGIHDMHKVYTAYGHAQSVSAVCLPRYDYMMVLLASACCTISYSMCTFTSSYIFYFIGSKYSILIYLFQPALFNTINP